MKPVGKEIRRRFPRLTMSLVMAFIFWIISIIVPPTVGEVVIPGLDLEAGFLVWIVTMLIMAVFLIRALSDALILGDILTDIFVKRLGIKQEASPKRAFRDFVYIIVVILMAAAIVGILKQMENFAALLRIITTYAALGIILILIYDIGRILYRIIEQRAQTIADRLEKMAEKSKESR
jgi:cation transport ATPase